MKYLYKVTATKNGYVEWIVFQVARNEQKEIEFAKMYNTTKKGTAFTAQLIREHL